MLVKLNYDLLSYKKNSTIETDNLPVKDQFYLKKRLKDAKIDNCIEIVDKKEKIIDNKNIENYNNKKNEDVEIN